ncbi:MAG: hypothetical protein NXI29_26470 [bacterium]|nr:hypothetical protein [bacterium]
MKNEPFAKVVKVLDEYSIVINRGKLSGVSFKNKFIIIEIGEEIKDPDTGEVLERLEIVKGIVKPKHIQDRISTLVSCETKIEPTRKQVTKSSPFKGLGMGLPYLGETTTETMIPGEAVLMELENVNIDDRVYIVQD